MNKTGLFLGGLLAGAAVGAALGILYAPKSGKETREQIKAKLADMEGELSKIRNIAKEKGSVLKDDIKSKVSDIENQIEQLLKEYKKATEQKV